MLKSIIALVAALSVTGMTSTPAAAEPVSVSVSYADLDLAAPAGATVLKHRIKAAADKVCGRPHMRDLKAMAAWEDCRTAAQAEAVARLSSVAPAKSHVLASLF